MIRSSASVPLDVASDRDTQPGIKRSMGRLSDLAAFGVADITRSSSGQSAFHLSSSASSGGTPLSARRRSTETSGSGAGLDYYWSNAAGVGPSSSSSSLAMSPSPSIGLVETLASGAGGGGRKGLYRRSEASLRDLIAQEQKRADGLADERAGGAVELESPSWSGESDYSSSHSLPMDGILGASPRQRHGEAKARPQAVNVWNVGEADNEYDFARQSMTSTSTTRSPILDDKNRTPVVSQTGDRPDIRPPGLSYTSDSLHATPIVSQTNFTRAQPSPSSYTPGSGRLDSTGIRRGGSPASGPSSAVTSPEAGPVTGTPLVGEPQSAPPWQGDFGLGMGSVGEDETIKSRNRDKRATLPAMPVEGELLSPEKVHRGTGSPQPPPRSALRTQLAGITSPIPNLSFDYNPSSVPHGPNSPLNISPSRFSHASTPTSSPPMSRESSSDHPIRLPSRLRDPALSTDSMHSKGSINDLTELLGGAIDEIGLIDSRETPPPMIAADSRDKPRPNPLSLSTSSLAPAVVLAISGEGDEERRPITPGSLPSRGESLSSGTSSAAGSGSGSGSALASGMVPAPRSPPTQVEAATSNAHQQHQRHTSTSTLHAPGSVVTGGFASRPWPAAMLYGHIKNMKHSGDRAKYYAKGINDLAIADSGLRDWCVISASSAHRVPPARVPLSRLQSNMTSLPRTEFAPSIHIQPALPSSLSSRAVPSSHPRNVSSSSEFPMREDSYTAREISQRVIDPGDEPTSLPPNLPYPQLQQVRNGGMRASPSTASMASMASTATNTTAVGSGGGGSGNSKRGFFSALRNKKDSGGLGPPTGPIGQSAGSGKKDVRGLPISNPERSSLSGPTPLGPRGPRMGGGSFASDISDGGVGPYRGSLDGISRLTPPTSAGPGRSSFDSSAQGAKEQRAGIGARLQHAAGSGAATPKEEEVRAMQDVLPHVDRGVLRAYLVKHGDQMSAITAYFEDEKRSPGRV